MRGDGICNDEINDEQCSYDHGDCCLSDMNTYNCQECLCSTNGVITSLGYPHFYKKNSDLTWFIQLSLGQFIHIDFVTVEIQDSP